MDQDYPYTATFGCGHTERYNAPSAAIVPLVQEAASKIDCPECALLRRRADELRASTQRRRHLPEYDPAEDADSELGGYRPIYEPEEDER